MARPRSSLRAAVVCAALLALVPAVVPPARARVDARPFVPVPVFAGEELRGLLRDIVRRHCGWDG